MSTRKGGVRSRKPRHQNSYAFKHNKNSKKTKRIANLPNTTLYCCPRCTSKIQWRVKYRKYKPLKEPTKWCVGSLASASVGAAVWIRVLPQRGWPSPKISNCFARPVCWAVCAVPATCVTNGR